MKNDICMIIPYFGKFPDWIDLFIQSCRKNSEIDFLFFTDDVRMSEYHGENINVVDMTFCEMQNLIYVKLGGYCHRLINYAIISLVMVIYFLNIWRIIPIGGIAM